MSYNIQEFQRMQYLLGKSKQYSLTFQEQDELRSLITKEQPSAQNNSIEDLIKLGLILVGVYIISKILEER
ncbi:MAG: hypothetical protein FIB08_03740 [Candidatus Methanoperedens sp.]|nr:hypothetical protein [Candidatus Methanoperedens sp.]